MNYKVGEYVRLVGPSQEERDNGISGDTGWVNPMEAHTGITGKIDSISIDGTRFLIGNWWWHHTHIAPIATQKIKYVDKGII